MAIQKFKVMPDGSGPFEVEATMRDVLKWEKVTPRASLKQLENEPRTADLYHVTYNACVRQGLFQGTLRDFEETCDIEAIGSEDPDPTRPEA